MSYYKQFYPNYLWTKTKNGFVKPFEHFFISIELVNIVTKPWEQGSSSIYCINECRRKMRGGDGLGGGEGEGKPKV